MGVLIVGILSRVMEVSMERSSINSIGDFTDVGGSVSTMELLL